MAMNGFTKDMNIIQKLNDEPNDRDGLTAGELKAKFDEGGLAVKDYLNNTVKPHVDGMEEAADAHAADTVKHITAAERTAWNNKVDKVSGKGLSTNDYTTAEKNKLAGIEAQANKYTHPAYTARTGKPTANLTPGFGDTVTVSQITSDATGHVTGATDRTIKIPATAASTTAAGLMSAADKTKLNGIAAGAQVNSITGVKGNAESSYRTGNVNLTPANLGAAAASHTHTSDAVTDLVIATKYGPTGLVSFTGKEGLPLKSLLADIEPVQAGSGNPSPSNVRPISGWTGAKVCATGKNLLPPMGTEDILLNGVQWTVNRDGTFYSQGISGSAYSQPYIADVFLPPGTYRLSGCPSGGANDRYFLRIVRYNGTNVLTSATDTGSGATFTVTGQETRLVVFANHKADITNKILWRPQIGSGTTATAYEPFGKLVDVSFGSAAGTVCGGTMDALTGLLTVTASAVELQTAAVAKLSQQSGYEHHFVLSTSISERIAKVDSTITCSHYKPVFIESAAYIGDYQLWPRIFDGVLKLYVVDPRYTTVSEMQDFLNAQKSAGTPVTLQYPVKNTTYQLTPQMISTLLGQNNIWADCGDVTVEYGAFLQALEGAVENHFHDAEDIASGILPVERGGTGNSTGYVTAGQKSGTTLGQYATAEGYQTTASGNYGSHAEGSVTVASGVSAHSEGENTLASGLCSHSEGTQTIAAGENQHVFGQYNVKNTAAVEIVGWGTSSARKNIRTLDREGNMDLAGTLTQSSDARLKDVEGEVPDVSSIRAVRFKWNGKKGTHDDRDHIGYIAQEVEKIAPFLVGDDSNGYKSLDYIALLCAKVEMLERRVAELEGGD